LLTTLDGEHRVEGTLPLMQRLSVDLVVSHHRRVHITHGAITARNPKAVVTANMTSVCFDPRSLMGEPSDRASALLTL
jgi:hypothetical protein